MYWNRCTTPCWRALGVRTLEEGASTTHLLELIVCCTKRAGSVRVSDESPSRLLSFDAGVNRDAVLVVDVAQKDERLVLPTLLSETVYEPSDTAFRLLQLFTRHPLEIVRDLPPHQCFRDLHVGLDIAKTYYAQGADRPLGSPLDLSLAEATLLRRRYVSFRDFLTEGLGLDMSPRPPPGKAKEHVVLIQRLGYRQLQNPLEVAMAARMALGTDVAVEQVALENITFSEQLQVRTCILPRLGSSMRV